MSYWVRNTELAWIWQGVAVYTLKLCGRLQYVGVTSNLAKRLLSGRAGKIAHPEWDEVVYLPFVDEDVDYACWLEERLIKRIKPVGNRIWEMKGQETGPIFAVNRRFQKTLVRRGGAKEKTKEVKPLSLWRNSDGSQMTLAEQELFSKLFKAHKKL